MTRSPIQYSDYKTKEEASIFKDYKECFVVLYVRLGDRQRDISPFITRGRHENIDVYYLSYRFLELPLVFKDRKNIIILYKYTAEAVQKPNIERACFDMGYQDYKELCKEAW